MSDVQPMILELIDANGDAHGDANVMVETFTDGRALLCGPVRLEVTGFVTDATWTLRHAWQDRTKPTYAFRLPEVRDADPWSVVVMESVMLDGPPPSSATNENHDGDDNGGDGDDPDGVHLDMVTTLKTPCREWPH